MPYRHSEDPPLASFVLRSSRSFPLVFALTVPLAVLGFGLVALKVPYLELSFGGLLHEAPMLLMGLVLGLLPWIMWKNGEPYLASGEAPALRLFRDRVEAPAARGGAVLRFPLDRLLASRSTTVVRHVTGLRLSEARFVALRAPGQARLLSTRLFESEDEADRALAAVLSLQQTGAVAAPVATTAPSPEAADAEYHARLQAELDRLR